MFRLSQVAAAITAIVGPLIVIPESALALSLEEFRKHPQDQQAVYIGAAVSMVAYSYAADGDVPKARCVQDWYFRGKEGQEPTGPRELAVELAAAERRDSSRLHVEGVVLGVAERTCEGKPAARSTQ